MLDTNRLANVIAELEAELRDTEERAAKLRRAVDAAREVLPPSPGERVVPAPLVSPVYVDLGVNGKGRPPLKSTILTFLRQGGTDGISLAALTEALCQRGWVGATKEGKPSKESVRGALLDLRRQGLVTGKEEGDTSWEPTLWRLRNTTLPRAPDLYSERGDRL